MPNHYRKNPLIENLRKKEKIDLNENQQAFKDPLHVPVGPITKARCKKIIKTLNGLIQDIWADSNVGHSKAQRKMKV